MVQLSLALELYRETLSSRSLILRARHYQDNQVLVVFANSGVFSREGEAALCEGGPCQGPRRVSINS